MNYRKTALLCFSISLFFSACKKDETEVELFPVTSTSEKIIFSNITSDTAFLDFALVRITQAHTLLNGTLNDGFALDTGTLPVTLLPNVQTELEKQRFVFKTDTLQNDDQLKTIGYNIRYFAEGDTVRKVKTFSKTF